MQNRETYQAAPVPIARLTAETIQPTSIVISYTVTVCGSSVLPTVYDCMVALKGYHTSQISAKVLVTLLRKAEPEVYEAYSSEKASIV